MTVSPCWQPGPFENELNPDTTFLIQLRIYFYRLPLLIRVKFSTFPVAQLYWRTLSAGSFEFLLRHGTLLLPAM